MQNFTSGQKGASLHVSKTSTKWGKQSIPPYNPDTNSLDLDLDWPRSKVHSLPDQIV
jgi:hypothetical protein